jgi:hypothetical protein
LIELAEAYVGSGVERSRYGSGSPIRLRAHPEQA